MSLPPRLPMPEFTADPADVPRLRSAARRRRAAQSGALGAVLTVAVVVSSNAGAPTGLRMVEPVATPSVAPTASVTTPPAGPARGAGPGAVVPRAPGSGVASPAASPAAVPTPTTLTPLAQRDFRVRATVVPNPGGVCEQHHRVAMTDWNFGAFEACTRATWPERTRHRAGADLSVSYCVTLGDAKGAFDAPRLEIAGAPGISWRYEDKGGMHTRSLTVRTGQCLVWTVFWAGVGSLEGGGLAWFPRDSHDVTVDVAPPYAYNGGERLGSSRLRTSGPITVV